MAKALDKVGIEYQEQVIMFDKFMVDFLLSNHPLVIQCDGIYWHDRPENRWRDKGQNNYLAKCGYTVLRFTDKEINSDIQQCIDVILHTLNGNGTEGGSGVR
jgi:very-short-patch-repair endonuclease